MPSLYLNRLSNQERERLVNSLQESQKGNCFICRQDVDSVLHAGSLDIDHIEPISAGGKDRPENFALTHDSCNRSKQASDLRVARVLASFSKLAQQMSEENRAPNLGDVLAEHGGSQYKLPVTLNESLLKTSFPDMGLNEVKTLPVYKDEISGFRSSFMNIPIEYLHHDDHINPRTIGSDLRKARWRGWWDMLGGTSWCLCRRSRASMLSTPTWRRGAWNGWGDGPLTLQKLVQ